MVFITNWKKNFRPKRNCTEKRSCKNLCRNLWRNFLQFRRRFYEGILEVISEVAHGRFPKITPRGISKTSHGEFYEECIKVFLGKSLEIFFVKTLEDFRQESAKFFNRNHERIFDTEEFLFKALKRFLRNRCNIF